MRNHNGSDSMGTKKILQDRDFLVPCRLLTEAIGLSVHPNNTYPYTELNHEPKILNPTSYQVVTHFYMGGGKGTCTQPALTSYVLLKFVLLTRYLYL